MNAQLLNKLFQSIASNDTDMLNQIAKTIISEEKKKGHDKLAKQLENTITIKSSVNKGSSNEKTNENYTNYGNMTTLPVSRRYNQTLATIVEHDKLKHHMILCPELEHRFDKIEKEYVARERLLLHGLKPRTKILLYGSPGCGKTLGAERIAWNLGLPLMKVKFDAIISSYFGESSSNLRAIFDASKEIPCVLLLDECDFIAKSRSLGQDVGEIPRIVNMLLMLLDEYDAPGILVATTNLEESLDKALFRRFDEVIEITRPGENEIKKIFDMTFSSFKLSSDINWDVIIKKVKGNSSANIVQIAENAAKTSILECGKNITQMHIEQAIVEKSKY